MTRAADMMRTHPRPPWVDDDVLARCIDACYDCAQTCTSCADACLGEENVAELLRCIRSNQDCADACAATGAMLSRRTEPDPRVLRLQVEACRAACDACGDECAHHAGHMEHCRVCADACRACERACGELLDALPA